MSRVRFNEWPLGQENGWQRFQPRPADGRHRTIRRADSLAEREAPLASRDAFGKAEVAVGDADLCETRVNVDEGAPARLVIFLAPDPQRNRAQDEHVSGGAEFQELVERGAKGPVVRPINPIVAPAERFEAVADVSRRVIQLGRPRLLLPIVNPGGNAAVFEVEHVVAKRAEAEQVLKAGPCLPTKSRPADGAAEDDLHGVGSMNFDSVLILLLIEERRVRLRVRVRNLLPGRSQAPGSWRAPTTLMPCIGTL